LRKLFSIAFVAILLLNVMGYYGVFLGMQYQNDRAMLKVLDADQYDDSQTLTLKIPVSIPYLADNEDFERVDGKFEHQGSHYRLIKQKYSNDTLTIICVRDQKIERMNQALSTYVKTFRENSADQTQRSKISVSFIKDFIPETFCLLTLTSGWEIDMINYGFDQHLTPTFTASVIHPPERA
jgi:hypothetical protein